MLTHPQSSILCSSTTGCSAVVARHFWEVEVVGSIPITLTMPCRLMGGHQFLALAMLVRFQPRQPYSGVVELVKRLSLEQEVDGSSPSSRATSVSEMEITEVYETSIIGSSPIPKTSPHSPIRQRQLIQDQSSESSSLSADTNGRISQSAEESDLKSVQ